ncbi:outer membrane lipoprotein-sorting protein [Pseudomonas frederiksbergensis]|uniref:outer membrane lipoprotein-sorting protein n=1 Tax=Pseudomonas frederiksbergensis TaxID=104087 RepID=UPI003D1A93BE
MKRRRRLKNKWSRVYTAKGLSGSNSSTTPQSKEQYFNKSGQLFKIRTSSDIREFPATAGTTEWRPNLFSMKNLETGHSTQVRFQQVLDQPIDAKIFTRRFMEIGL